MVNHAGFCTGRGRARTVRAAAFALGLAALAPPPALGHVDAEELKRLSVSQLKTAYLVCDGAASNGQLGAAEIMKCSVVYEHLKRRAFDGDFIRFLAWSRAHPVPDAPKPGQP